jgi:spermidine synthase
MMGFLLFDSCPGRIVMLGLGGGSLAKFCYRMLPTAEIDVVEINPHVIALRRHFAIPEDDERFRVVCEDAAEFVARTTGTADVVLADAFDDDGLAGSLAQREFLPNVHASLSPAGMLVMNLAGDKSRYVDLIEAADDIFERRTVLVRVEDGHNHVLFAFKDRMFDPGWRQLRRRAEEIRAQCGLDFPAFVHKMERASRNRSRTQSA